MLLFCFLSSFTTSQFQQSLCFSIWTHELGCQSTDISYTHLCQSCLEDWLLIWQCLLSQQSWSFDNEPIFQELMWMKLISGVMLVATLCYISECSGRYSINSSRFVNILIISFFCWKFVSYQDLWPYLRSSLLRMWSTLITNTLSSYLIF